MLLPSTAAGRALALAVPAPERALLGRLELDPLDLPQALDAVAALVRGGRGGRVFTPGAEQVLRAERDLDLRRAYARAQLSLAGDALVLWTARLLGAPLPARLGGEVLVGPLAERAARCGWRLYLLGACPQAACEAAQHLRLSYGVEVVGFDSPWVQARGPDPEGQEALRRLRATRPDLLLVSLGSPRQELWLDRHALELGPTVAVAASAGGAPEAPARPGLRLLPALLGAALRGRLRNA